MSDTSTTTSLSYPSSDDSYDPDDRAALIQEEWEESMAQIEMVISVILMPVLGKWIGRRTAFWAYDRYKQFGWTRALIGM